MKNKKIKDDKNINSFLGFGLVSAGLSMLCCSSVLILLGISAISLSWINSIRPYLLLFALLLFGIALYRIIIKKKENAQR